MIADLRSLDQDHAPALIAVCIGNSSVQVGVFRDAWVSLDPDSVRSCPADDPAGGIALVKEADCELESLQRIVAVASVNPPVAHGMLDQLRAAFVTRIVRIPEELPVPIATALAADAKPGVDRLLASAAAFHVLRQACAVVDAGTAMTVNFVDGEGVFQGGVIAPGLRMALRALHEQTAALPSLDFQPPGDGWIGKNTQQAMLQGVCHSARGLVRSAVERFAEAYEAYPIVIACGGDARALFDGDEFVDRVVPDLVLRGIALAIRAATHPSGDDQNDSDEA